MIKLVATGVWICIVALASVYASIELGAGKADEAAPPPLFGGLRQMKGELISIPVISEGEVKGYFLTRLSFTVDPMKSAQMTIPVSELVTDTLYSELVGNAIIDFPNMKKFDLTAFRNLIRDGLNARLEDEVFHDVVVEQLDFLSKEDIRSNLRQGRTSLKTGVPVGSATVGDQ